MIKAPSSESLVLPPDHSYSAANDADGWSPLHYAAARDDAETARLLLSDPSNSIDPSAKTPSGATALVLASWLGHKDTVEVLLADQRTGEQDTGEEIRLFFPFN